MNEHDVRKNPVAKAAAVKLAKGMSTIHVCRGAKITTINVKSDKPTSGDIEKAILGRSGTLKAPTLVKGKTLVAGFNEELWSELLGV